MPEQERSPAREPDPVPIRAGTPGTRLDALPATLRWAIWLLMAEAAGLLVLAGVLAYDGVTGTAQSATSGVAIVVFTLLMTVFTAGLAVALTRRRRWARGPALVLELLLIPIGYSITTNGVAGLGIVLIVIGLAGIGTLVAPATRTALETRDR